MMEISIPVELISKQGKSNPVKRETYPRRLPTDFDIIMI